MPGIRVQCNVTGRVADEGEGVYKPTCRSVAVFGVDVPHRSSWRAFPRSTACPKLAGSQVLSNADGVAHPGGYAPSGAT